MYVKLGPYKNWIGPYQIADAVFFWVKEKHMEELEHRWDYRLHDRFGNWLADTWVNDLCVWIDKFRNRTVVVQIDRWDTYNMDHTLSLIILPMLKQLKESKHGAPAVDDEDVPEELWSTNGEKENLWSSDSNYFKRWDWVIDELIWTFEQLSDENSDEQFYSGEHDIVRTKNEDGTLSWENGPKDTFKVDREGLEAHHKRIKNGLRLFGKYFQGLWD